MAFLGFSLFFLMCFKKLGFLGDLMIVSRDL